MKEIYQNKKENLQNNKGGRNREMTFREQIRNLAGSQSYSRGLQIYNRGKVLRFHIEEAESVHADENVIIEADVEGSRSTPYHVYLMWNTVWEDLVESECSCPAFWEYDGICKHCVAVLLRYYYETKNRTDQMNLMQIPGIQKGMARKTTGSIQQLLQKGALVKSLPMIQGDICGKVRLEPHMVVENTGITVSFKLGINRMYVLKDVFGFARAIENHEKFFMGKICSLSMLLNRSFHSPDHWYLFLCSGQRKMNIGMEDITAIIRFMGMPGKNRLICLPMIWKLFWS